MWILLPIPKLVSSPLYTEEKCVYPEADNNPNLYARHVVTNEQDEPRFHLSAVVWWTVQAG